MVEEIDVSEVVEAVDRVQASYRKPLIRHTEEEKPDTPASGPKDDDPEDRKPV